MIKLTAPLKESDIRKLKAGDHVEISGILFTARDEAHKFLVKNNFRLDSNVLYHCGPIVKDNKVIAAGPTTSIREEPYESAIIEKYKIRAIIGKGGMGNDTAEALKKFGCVYLAAVGGAASILAEKIVKIKEVHKLKEFGMPEAIWVLEVRDFPAIVAMDTHGNSLYQDVKLASEDVYNQLIK